MRPSRTWANRTEVITKRRLIVGHHKAGKSIREISRLMGITKATVRLWIRRYKEEGHVTTRPRSGRPRITSSLQDQTLIDAARQMPYTNAVDLTKELQLPCHPVTTRRRLHEGRLNCHMEEINMDINSHD